MLNEDQKIEIKNEIKADGSTEIKIMQGDQNFLLGTLGSDKIARAGIIFVHPKLRGSGLSQKFLELFINIAKENRCTKLAGYTTTPSAIKFAAKLVGRDKINIYDLNTNKKINYDEAINSDLNYVAEIELL